MEKWDIEIRDAKWKVTDDDGKKRIYFVGIIYIDDKFFLKGKNPMAFATVIAKDQFKEYEFVIDGDYDCCILIKKSIEDIATIDELNALLKHEFLHFLLGHRKSITNEENLALDKKVEEEMTKEEVATLSGLSIRYMMMKREAFHPFLKDYTKK